MNISNCYNYCLDYYYLDELNDFHCIKTCPINYSKIILSQNRCIDDCKNDKIYKYEYNYTCYMKCPTGTYILEGKTNYK